MSPFDWLPAAIRERSPLRRLEAGENLFRQADRAFGIFEVEHGRLRLIRHTIDNHPVVLHTAKKGEFFAEAALFSSTYHCDAVAVISSQVRIYSKRQLLAAFRDDPVVGERFMAVLARQIHALRTRLEERNIRSARERLLHHLALNVGSDGRTVPLHGTLMELASEIGLSHEALYRALAALEAAGTIQRLPGRIVLLGSASL